MVNKQCDTIAMDTDLVVIEPIHQVVLGFRDFQQWFVIVREHVLPHRTVSKVVTQALNLGRDVNHWIFMNKFHKVVTQALNRSRYHNVLTWTNSCCNYLHGLLCLTLQSCQVWPSFTGANFILQPFVQNFYWTFLSHPWRYWPEAWYIFVMRWYRSSWASFILFQLKGRLDRRNFILCLILYNIIQHGSKEL